MSAIGTSFSGMLVGLVCFLLSWPVLYCGASRPHWDRVFRKAVPVEQAGPGQAVFITGIPESEKIGDEPRLAKGNYLKILKSVEVYAYVEHKKSKKEEHADTGRGSREAKPEYSYTLEWTSTPKEIQGFNRGFWEEYRKRNRIPINTVNPVITDAEKEPRAVYAPSKINGYDIDIREVDFRGGEQSLGGVYLKGKESFPRHGDKRISYRGHPSGIEYTFAGSLSNKKLTGYYHNEDHAMLVAAPGSFHALIAALKRTERVKGALWFLGGFLLMAVGLNLLLGPITTLLEFIPLLGQLGAGLVRIVLALAALVLSAVFWWVIKLWWVVVLAVLLAAAFTYYRKKTAGPAVI